MQGMWRQQSHYFMSSTVTTFLIYLIQCNLGTLIKSRKDKYLDRMCRLCKLIRYNKCEILTAVKMSMLAFWVATSRVLEGRYQSFEETYCFHLQGGIKLLMCSQLQLIRNWNILWQCETQFTKHTVLWSKLKIPSLFNSSNMSRYNLATCQIPRRDTIVCLRQ
jgi:hypothetical protein